jgi:hypothetical protein
MLIEQRGKHPHIFSLEPFLKGGAVLDEDNAVHPDARRETFSLPRSDWRSELQCVEVDNSVFVETLELLQIT